MNDGSLSSTEQTRTLPREGLSRRRARAAPS